MVPAKSVAADDIEFPHALHPQHHVPLPPSVISYKEFYNLVLFIYIQRVGLNASRVALGAFNDVCLSVYILQVTGEKHDKDERDPTFAGLFFNYFSVGKLSFSIHLLWDF